MVELECYVEQGYEILKSSESKRSDYLDVFEKLAMQYAETITLARNDLTPLPAKKIVRIIVLLDLLRMKLS